MHNFNLLENAADSLSHALEHLLPVKQSMAGDWKRVIRDIAHTIELLVKERLRIIHPAFLLNNIDKYPSTDAFTVGAELAFERLQKVGGLHFSDENKNAVKMARVKRNEIEHYQFNIDDDQAKILVGQGLSFIFSFTEEHLELDWKADHLKEEHWPLIREYTDLYIGLVAQAEARIENDHLYTLDCTCCGNDTYSHDYQRCLVCSMSEETIECSMCKNDFLESSTGLQICSDCEYLDGYAAAHHEKY